MLARSLLPRFIGLSAPRCRAAKQQAPHTHKRSMKISPLLPSTIPSPSVSAPSTSCVPLELALASRPHGDCGPIASTDESKKVKNSGACPRRRQTTSQTVPVSAGLGRENRKPPPTSSAGMGGGDCDAVLSQHVDAIIHSPGGAEACTKIHALLSTCGIRATYCVLARSKGGTSCAPGKWICMTHGAACCTGAAAAGAVGVGAA
eukprot:scaffold60321_cov32-Tisochrysis_lutea.AAC.2